MCLEGQRDGFQENWGRNCLVDLDSMGPLTFTIHTPEWGIAMHCRTETLSVGKKVLGKKRQMQRQVYLGYSFLTFWSWQRELKGQERPGMSPQVCLHLRGRQSSVPGQPSSQLYEFTSSVPTSAPLDHSFWEHCGIGHCLQWVRRVCNQTISMI